MMLKYLSFSISIAFISFIVGMIVNAALRNVDMYNQRFSNLNFIRNEKVNKMMGIFIFKWLMKNTALKYFNQKLVSKNKAKKSDLLTLRSEMTKAELDHLIGFLFVTIFAVVKFVTVGILFALTIMAVNILMNLYPSLLQQLNKRRIDRLLQRL